MPGLGFTTFNGIESRDRILANFHDQYASCMDINSIRFKIVVPWANCRFRTQLISKFNIHFHHLGNTRFPFSFIFNSIFIKVQPSPYQINAIKRCFNGYCDRFVHISVLKHNKHQFIEHRREIEVFELPTSCDRAQFMP